MKITPNAFVPLLASLGAVVAIAAAPVAAASSGTPAQPHQACSSLGSTQSLCESSGNVQINDSLPQVDYFPYAGGAT